MTFTPALMFALLASSTAFVACGPGETRTVTASRTTVTGPSGGESRTDVHETQTQGADGHATDSRTVTTDRSTPATPQGH